MRVIAGKWKSLRLQAPKGQNTRPTTDRVKESMFNLLPHALDGTVVDLFAGSGALGIEAMSRGATSAVFIERDFHAVRTLRANLAQISALPTCRIWQDDWRRGLARLQGETLSWVFVDPPYREMLWEPVMQKLDSFRITGGIVCETPKTVELPVTVHGFQKVKYKVYGDIAVSVFLQEVL